MANYKKIAWGASVMVAVAGIDYLFNDTSMNAPISSVFNCASYVVNNCSPYNLMDLLFYGGEAYGILKVLKGCLEDKVQIQHQQQVANLQQQVACLQQQLQTAQNPQPPAAPATPAAPPANPPATP